MKKGNVPNFNTFRIPFMDKYKPLRKYTEQLVSLYPIETSTALTPYGKYFKNLNNSFNIFDANFFSICRCFR